MLRNRWPASSGIGGRNQSEWVAGFARNRRPESRGICTYSGDSENETVLEEVLAKNYCLFETDALVKAAGFPNPAGVGTFPRILGTYVRDKKLFSLENAVHRMTGASAARFGFQDTGTLLKGKVADIVCFDPETVAYNYDDPEKPADRPEGIVHVFMNGEQVVQDGAYISGIKAGRVLRC